MPIYWFFDLPAVAQRNLFLSQSRFTESFRDIAHVMAEIRRTVSVRPAARIPLP